MTDAKFKLEDILNKKKAPPQILDLANIKIESEEDFRAVIEKIPDYRIQPERPEETQEQIEVLSQAMKQYKKYRQLRRSQYVQQLDRALLRGDIDLSTVDPTKQLEDTLGELQCKKSRTHWKDLILRQKIKSLLKTGQDSSSSDSDVVEPMPPLRFASMTHLVAVKQEILPPTRGKTLARIRAMAQENAPDFPEDQLEGLKEKPMSAKKSLLFVPQPAYQFADPCPESMRGVKISDLSSVDINWKMLTLARPNNKTDEEIFSKLVQLDKLRLQTRAKEAEQALARGGKDPFIVVKNPSASKGGVAEKSIKTCSECAEEFCSGTCKEFQYDAYQRLVLPEKEVEIAGNEVQSSKKKGKKKRKKRKKSSGTKKVSQMPVTEEDEED